MRGRMGFAGNFLALLTLLAAHLSRWRPPHCVKSRRTARCSRWRCPPRVTGGSARGPPRVPPSCSRSRCCRRSQSSHSHRWSATLLVRRCTRLRLLPPPPAASLFLCDRSISLYLLQRCLGTAAADVARRHRTLRVWVALPEERGLFSAMAHGGLLLRWIVAVAGAVPERSRRRRIRLLCRGEHRSARFLGVRGRRQAWVSQVLVFGVLVLLAGIAVRRPSRLEPRGRCCPLPWAVLPAALVACRRTARFIGGRWGAVDSAAKRRPESASRSVVASGVDRFARGGARRVRCFGVAARTRGPPPCRCRPPRPFGHRPQSMRIAREPTPFSDGLLSWPASPRKPRFAATCKVRSSAAMALLRRSS